MMKPPLVVAPSTPVSLALLLTLTAMTALGYSKTCVSQCFGSKLMLGIRSKAKDGHCSIGVAFSASLACFFLEGFFFFKLVASNA